MNKHLHERALRAMRTRRPRSQQRTCMNALVISALRALCGQDVRAPGEALK